MNRTQTETVEWYVIFRSSQLSHWVFRWLEAPWQHCYAMRKTAGGQMWIVVDPRSAHTAVTTEFVDDYPHPRLYAGANAVILKVEARINADNTKPFVRLFSCVEVVKSLLGIKNRWIITPHQLYERLTNG